MTKISDDVKSEYIGGVRCTIFGHAFGFTDGVQNETCDCGETSK